MTAAFEQVLLVLLAATLISGAARWLPWPAPITLVLGGLALAWLPGFPDVSLDPETFFLCFLPPLLFADGWLMPLREFLRAKRPILLLAIGLVVFTTVIVGLVLHALVPALPLALCFAFGALISPTDAVAVGAITERLRVPARLNAILNGESLMNDATGLVAFKFALAALAAGGGVSLPAMAGDFAFLAVGGSVVGFVVAVTIGFARDLLRQWRGTDALVETTVSLMTPYAAYLAATALGMSGILAVALAGLYSGWRDPIRMDVDTRRTAWSVWSTLLFWLNGLAFLLIGLQAPTIFAGMLDQVSVARWAGLTALVTAVTVVGRIAWFFPAAWLPRLLVPAVRRSEPMPDWRLLLVGGWAGMRGAVTLAAALSIPLTLPNGTPVPGRDVVIALAFGVTLATLLLHGTTLPWLIRTLGVREGGSRDEEERTARIAAIEAGLGSLRAFEESPLAEGERSALGIVKAEYAQRLAVLTTEGEHRELAQQQSAACLLYRRRALAAERSAIDALWRQDRIDDTVHRPLQLLLDHEEAMLGTEETRAS
jgi:monovalent cation/hydrogen antiporter